MSTELTAQELRFLLDVMELARQGQTEQLVSVLEQGVPVDLSTSDGDSLLILAAYHAHLETVQALLVRGADPDRVNDRGQSALGAAVFRQATEVVEALLAAGADPHQGRQSAYAVADVFELDAMRTLLQKYEP